MAVKFSFMVLTWNRHAFLERCLQGLVASLDRPGECEVVVMDNGSTDGTGAVLARYAGSGLVRVIRRDRNYGIAAYKKLFGQARGEFGVVVDDDVLAFPKGLDSLFTAYMSAYPDYGYMALNVVQDEWTNGAKPGPEQYVEDRRGERVVEHGPTGGWCACFRMRDYRRIRLRMLFARFDMKNGDDGYMTKAFRQRLGLKSGIIREAVCLHASGPHYARQYGYLDRDIEKYRQAGLADFVEEYRRYRE